MLRVRLAMILDTPNRSVFALLRRCLMGIRKTTSGCSDSTPCRRTISTEWLSLFCVTSRQRSRRSSTSSSGKRSIRVPLRCRVYCRFCLCNCIVALLTERIRRLTEHLWYHHKVFVCGEEVTCRTLAQSVKCTISLVEEVSVVLSCDK